MNPLSLLFRALDSALRRFLSLRTTLRSTPWRRHARTALDRVIDRHWWRAVADRAVALIRRPGSLRIGLAALLGGVVVAATATTAVAVNSGDGNTHATQAADATGLDSAARRQAAASRNHDRPAPDPSRTSDRRPAQRGQQPDDTRERPDNHQPETKRKPDADRKSDARLKGAAKQRNGAKQRHRYVARGSSWRLPVHAKHFWVSSRFGRRWGVLHAGVDLAVPMRTPIRAAHSGRVSIAGRYDGYGRAVGIENGHGIATVYGHASKVLVHDGQWVRAGQVVALSGNSGDSHGPHLHFEMRRHGVAFNPLPYLKGHGVHVLRAAGHG